MTPIRNLEEWKKAIYCKIVEDWCFEDMKNSCPQKVGCVRDNDEA